MLSKTKLNNEKKKGNVGIFTLFYKSYNYGGLLQAYALTKAINNLNFNASQINYNYRIRSKKLERDLFNYYSFSDILSKIYIKLKKNSKPQANLSGRFKQRIVKANKFADSIPHTQDVYTEENTSDLLERFDTFVVGSDQIWNEYSPTFFLEFVPQNYGKISYAASMSKTGLSKKKLKYMAKHIEKFDFVSVRESSAKESLEPFVNQKIHLLLDPTFLLDKTEWHSLAKDYVIARDYIFVYLLGDNIEHRQRIKEIADLLGLAIVFIPHVHLAFRETDKNFADYELYDVGPEEFVGLIKNANIIITDSFHGCVISAILEKNFWAVKRHRDSNLKNMNSRLYTLFENMKIDDRFLETISNEEVLSREIDYDSVNNTIDNLRQDSIKYLGEALNKCVEKR